MAHGGTRKTTKARKPRAPLAKFDSIKRKRYLDLLADGNTRYNSAYAAGVSHELVRQYRMATPGWKEEEGFAEALANGKVANALFQAALDGNVTAIQVWLYNRASDQWKDKRNVEHSGPSGGPIQLGIVEVIVEMPPLTPLTDSPFPEPSTNGHAAIPDRQG